jgi:hypothetical protein
VGQAYNPYTGSYGATHQGSSPTAQWGQSYVSNGNKSATSQHYSTANGTVASAQGSQGGKAYGTSSAYGSTYAGKSSSGDLYAGHDGNVYQKNGSTWEKSNGNGGWSDVNTQQAKQEGQQDKSTYEQQHPNSQAQAQQDKSNFNQNKSSGSYSSENLDSEKQNRDYGSAQSQHYQSGNHSYGGYGGGGRSWGGGGGRSYGGGGFRR